MKNSNCVKQELCKRVQEKMSYSGEITDEEVEDLVDQTILEFETITQYPIEERRKWKDEIFNSLRRLDLLQKYIDDPTITEIMVNGKDRIFLETQGEVWQAEEQFETEEKLMDVIQRIVAGCNRVVNEASPIVDARLPNGSRVSVVMKPVALNGPIVTIRRFPEKPITMERLITDGTLTKEAAEFLEGLVRAKYNILVSGGTGSGKTTFLNVLSQFISRSERVITIEDSAELQLMDLPNLVRLETRNSNVAGCREITIRDLIRTSLRMRPERIIVGEVRGEEALDMLQCLNTGHDGSMSTAHANSAKDMLSRLENMVLCGVDMPPTAIRKQIVSGVDIIVHLGRLPDRTRKVMEIAEVMDCEDGEIRLNPLFTYEEHFRGDVIQGMLIKRGELKNEIKCKATGLS